MSSCLALSCSHSFQPLFLCWHYSLADRKVTHTCPLAISCFWGGGKPSWALLFLCPASHSQVSPACHLSTVGWWCTFKTVRFSGSSSQTSLGIPLDSSRGIGFSKALLCRHWPDSNLLTSANLLWHLCATSPITTQYHRIKWGLCSDLQDTLGKYSILSLHLPV